MAKSRHFLRFFKNFTIMHFLCKKFVFSQTSFCPSRSSFCPLNLIFFFQWKLTCCSFTFQNPEVNRANILARLKPQKLLKKGKIPFFHQNLKLARLSSVCIRCQNGPRNRRERPIFDLRLSWFALITLKTASRDSFTKKTPRALEWNPKCRGKKTPRMLYFPILAEIPIYALHENCRQMKQIYSITTHCAIKFIFLCFLQLKYEIWWLLQILPV